MSAPPTNESGLTPEWDGISEFLTALVAENERLRKTLTWITEASYTGNFDDATTIAIHRQWAKNALERPE